jgi:hypothetical protein
MNLHSLYETFLLKQAKLLRANRFLLTACFGLLLNLEDGGSMFFQSVSELLLDCTALASRRQHFS